MRGQHCTSKVLAEIRGEKYCYKMDFHVILYLVIIFRIKYSISLTLKCT